MSLQERQAIVDKYTKQIKENIKWKDEVKVISLGQKDSLIKILNQLGGIHQHWDLNGSREELGKMTESQYKYLLHLAFEKHLIKINNVLETLNIKRK